MSEANKILLAELILVRDAGGNTDYGICWSIDVTVRDMIPTDVMLEELFVKWPKFSGCTAYPIRGSWRAYDEAKLNDTLWDRDTDYGALRWELLEWLIEELQK